MLLERETQLAALRRRLDETGNGRGGVVAVAGEAGAGKTTLVNAFANAIGRQARVLRAACEDLAIPDPLGPLYDLAHDAGWPLERLDQAEGGRIALFAAAREMFDTGSQPTVLIVEDLHWADDATLDFVRYLGRRIAGTHLLLVLTGRNDGSDGQKRLRRALGDIAPDNVARIDVPLLSESAVAQLALSSGRDSGEVYRASAGNAFFATELLRAGAGALPQSVRDATLARAERLAPEQRAALEAVSIFPRRAERTILLPMLGAAGAEQLEACVSAGMLEQSGGSYSFRHEIARRAIEAALPAYQREALNAAVLATLRHLPATPAARLAHHAVEAHDAGAVRELSPLAAHEASRIGAHREAAEHYRAMLRVADGFTPEEHAQVLGRFAFEAHLVGRLPDAIEAQKAAREIYRRLQDVLMEGDTVRWLSRLSYLNGKRDDAETFGTEAIALLETQTPGPELAMAYSNRSHLAMLADASEESIVDGRSAIALGQVLGRPDIVSHALNNMGTARIWVDAAAGIADLEESLRIALAHNYQEHAARAYTNLACSLVTVIDYRAARRTLEDGIAYCRDRDLDTWSHYMSGWLAEVLLRQGEWATVADVALPILGNENASPMMRFMSAISLARLRLRRGDPGLDEPMAEARRFLVANHELQRLAPFATLLAEAAWLSGDTTEALRALEEAEALMPAPTLHGDLALWRLRLEPNADVATAELSPPYRAEAEGDWQQAAQFWRDAGAPYDAAMALAWGDETAQREAVAMLERLGAHPVANRVRFAMRRSGIANVAAGPRQSTRDNALGLTRREMQILRLVDSGLSSKRIAVELEISPKTVDHHVAALLEKLGAHSRLEASARARSAGLL
ncbi:MAG: AAA family ATPase [Rubrivivax sp.]